MATADSVKAKLQGQIDKINAATGGTDTTLAGAVDTVIAGFGQGGGGDVEAFLTNTIDNVIFPESVSTVRQHIFEKNTNLKTVSGKNVTMVGLGAFNGCTALESVSFSGDGCNYQTNAFTNCTSLETVDVSSIVNLATIPFSGTGIKSLYFPVCNRISFRSLSGMKKLESVEFLVLTQIDGLAFENDEELKTLILRNNTVATPSSVSAFTGTPFAVGGTGGTVYVPAALIESYQTATNWVTLYEAGTCNFVAIEGSEYE